MKRIKPFNRYEVTSTEFNFLQDVGQDEIKARMRDGVLTYGLVVPYNATPSDIAGGIPTVFNLVNNGTTLSVCPSIIAEPTIHLAYDKNGQRIEIPAGDDAPSGVLWNTNAPTFVTNNIGGWYGATPFSTGRENITLSGGAGWKYVFVSYVPVTETKSSVAGTPPYHENLDGDVTTATDRRLPITSLDQKEGKAYAHHRIDGYRIYVANAAEVDNAGVGLVPTLKTSVVFPGEDEDASAALYIGRCYWTGAFAVSGFCGSDTLDKRPLLLQKPITASVVGDRATPVTLTTAYVAGMAATLNEHLGAVGTGVVTPQNPHGEELENITGGLSTVLQKEVLADGIIYESADQYNPIPSSTDALKPVIVNAPISTLTTPVSFAQSGGGTLDYAAGTTFNAYVHIKQNAGVLPTGTEVYLDGERLNTLVPTNPDDTTNKYGFVAFTTGGAYDAVGTYVIFGRTLDAVNNPGEMILGKALESVTLAAGEIPLCKVYWNGTNLRRSPVSPAFDIALPETYPEEMRNFGIIGKGQISSDGFKNPNTGMFAAQAFANMVGNGRFEMRVGATSTTPEQWVISASPETVYGVIINEAGDADMVNSGPKTLTGLDVTLLVPNNVHDLRIRNKIEGLKPNTIYTASVWLRRLELANAFDMVLRITDLGGTLSGIANEIPFQVDRTTTNWQRLTATFETDSSFDVTDTKYFELRLQKAATVSGTHEMHFASICVVEGEWAAPYLGPRVNSGEIFMWDKSTSCPPGSELVTSLQGKIPEGYNGSLAIGASTTTTGLNTASVYDNHVHENGMLQVASGGGPFAATNTFTYGARVGWGDANPNYHGHQLPITAVLFCRRL